MSQNITLTFALLFGAVITVICAVYVALIERKRRKSLELKENDVENVQ